MDRLPAATTTMRADLLDAGAAPLRTTTITGGRFNLVAGNGGTGTAAAAGSNGGFVRFGDSGQRFADFTDQDLEDAQEELLRRKRLNYGVYMGGNAGSSKGNR